MKEVLTNPRSSRVRTWARRPPRKRAKIGVRCTFTDCEKRLVAIKRREGRRLHLRSGEPKVSV